MGLSLKITITAFACGIVLCVLLLVFNDPRLLSNFTYKQDVHSLNDSNEYAKALSKWDATGINHYTIVVETSGLACLNCGIFTIEVQGSQIISSPLPLDQYSPLTVEGLFALAKDYVQSDGRCKYLYDQIAWQYTIEYDQQYGYPTRIDREDAQVSGGVRECGFPFQIKVISFLK